ncbi:MAG: ABC transporter permease subunit [Deltaproteobacteria bacterium]|nr:ABC transporter permease subunit [Deltaproteobacteria bacterium]
MRERALIAGQFPARRSLFLEALPGLAIPPKQALGIIERATPRPVTPVYTELSQILQVHLHRALTGQEGSQSALAAANEEVTALLDSIHPRNAVPSRANPWIWRGAILLLALGALIALLLRRARRRRRPTAPPGSSALHEAGLAWSLVAPALACIALTAAFPLAWTAWESLHRRDLRTPWLGAPFVGLANYLELLSSPRFWGALGRTAFFTGMSVVLELGLGLVLALGLNRAFRGRGLARAAVLLPWAVPTVVAAIIWRFMFDSRAGIAHAALADLGVVEPTFVWFVDAAGAWVPVILADVWKTTPFVALLLLAGLQSIDESLYEAAKVDGAGALSQLVYITLPLLRPALLVALLFRTLDSFRVFDLIYVLTGGGPGTATEPVSLLTFSTLLEHLRFGLGSALSMVVFGVSFLVAVLYLRVLGAELTGRAE